MDQITATHLMLAVMPCVLVVFMAVVVVVQIKRNNGK